MKKVMIEVLGGNVQRITASPGVQVVVVDWDNIRAGDDKPREFTRPDLVTEGMDFALDSVRDD